MAPSRYDWKIVDWDVKPQHNQPTNLYLRLLVVADIEIRKISKGYHFKIEIKIQTFESLE